METKTSTRTASREVGLTRRGTTTVPVLDDPPIGHLQALVLKKLQELKSEAYGYNVLQDLSIETGMWIDHSQIYNIIRKLDGKDLIEVTETRRTEGRGAPVKIYKLTATGIAALNTTKAHYRAMADRLERSAVKSSNRSTRKSR